MTAPIASSELSSMMPVAISSTEIVCEELFRQFVERGLVPSAPTMKQAGTYEPVSGLWQCSFDASPLLEGACLRICYVPCANHLAIIHCRLRGPDDDQKVTYSLQIKTSKLNSIKPKAKAEARLVLRNTLTDRLVYHSVNTLLGWGGKKQGPTLDTLADELLVNVARHLDAQSLGRLATVSRRLRQVVSSPPLWEGHCRREFPSLCRGVGHRSTGWQIMYRLQASERRRLAVQAEARRRTLAAMGSGVTQHRVLWPPHAVRQPAMCYAGVPHQGYRRQLPASQRRGLEQPAFMPQIV